mmetsp:Transcript_121841/g.248730  ORF Transcript_121841/g.248730 Transcript_121841/m.248730 type:complete len:83 (+) Transcript_121841:2-250(+)
MVCVYYINKVVVVNEKQLIPFNGGGVRASLIFLLSGAFATPPSDQGGSIPLNSTDVGGRVSLKPQYGILSTSIINKCDFGVR